MDNLAKTVDKVWSYTQSALLRPPEILIQGSNFDNYFNFNYTLLDFSLTSFIYAKENLPTEEKNSG